MAPEGFTNNCAKAQANLILSISNGHIQFMGVDVEVPVKLSDSLANSVQYF